MNSGRCNIKSRTGFRSRSLVRAVVGVGCLRLTLTLALTAGSDAFRVNLAATAILWLSCAVSLILLALLDWDVRDSRPGLSSLTRRFSYVALAGSLLPVAASLGFFMGTAPALAAALAGFALTLSSAILLEWLLRDIRPGGRLPCQDAILGQLKALHSIVGGIASGELRGYSGSR